MPPATLDASVNLTEVYRRKPYLLTGQILARHHTPAYLKQYYFPEQMQVSSTHNAVKGKEMQQRGGGQIEI